MWSPFNYIQERIKKAREQGLKIAKESCSTEGGDIVVDDDSNEEFIDPFVNDPILNDNDLLFDIHDYDNRPKPKAEESIKESDLDIILDQIIKKKENEKKS